MFQSMLSTQGHELGMIEDLDIAALWLSLVTVRLVVKEDDEEEDDEDERNQDKDDYDRDRDAAAAFIGKGDGVICRRDKVSVCLHRSVCTHYSTACPSVIQ